MRPKGKLFALFAVFAAIGLVTASGAFTTVTAERTAEVNAAGDANALLGIQPSDTPNGEVYADNGSSGDAPEGEVEISLNGDFGDNTDVGSGVNNDATTEINRVINITHQGGQDEEIYVQIERSGTNSGIVSFYEGTTDDTNITSGSDNAMDLNPGESAFVSIKVNTSETSVGESEEIIDDITIVAESSNPTN